MRRFDQDYSNLQEFLDSSSKKLQFPVMVPITNSGLAFVKGRIHNTNQVLISMGDNWFTEQTIHGALGVAKRRKDLVQDQIKKIETIVDELKHRLSHSTGNASLESGEMLNEDGEPFYEIREEYQETEKSVNTNPKKPTKKTELDQFDLNLLSKLRLMDDEPEQVDGIEIVDSEESEEEEDEDGELLGNTDPMEAFKRDIYKKITVDEGPDSDDESVELEPMVSGVKERSFEPMVSGVKERQKLSRFKQSRMQGDLQ
ncbi:hypothetical protein EDD86DRAFT_246304 [Gorgonomyces haynaldii]|nr:hypothetical protein EDD86DRAFT_246304 [Gorgonomyces haynaldii]